MTDALIDRLTADLTPTSPRTLERRLFIGLAIGLAVSLLGVYLVLDLTMQRPFGAAWGSDMFWVKVAYALAFGGLGLAAAPVLSRPDGRIIWPLAVSALLFILALGVGGMLWMRADWNMPMLMGLTALVCPWLILLTSLPMLGALLLTMRHLAPRSPTLAGSAAGLLAGGLGAAVYALYCGETGMLFMAVWYSLGIALTAALGALAGRWLLRW
jgi:hypothetical protein